MRILSLLNVSNPSNLAADSGFVFQRLLLEALERMGHRVWLVAPEEAARMTTVQVLPLRPPPTKYHARYDFDWQAVGAATAAAWPEVDVVLVNQPELAASLAAMAAVMAARRVLIVSYIHYLPIEGECREGRAIPDASLDDGGMARWITSNIRSAVENSDLTLIGSDFGGELLRRHVGSPRRLVVLPPPVEPSLAGLAMREPDPGPLKLLYNHRLYAHYGTETLFNWLDRAHVTTGGGFEVWLTDPTGERSELRKRFDPASHALRYRVVNRPYVRVVGAETRADYHSLIARTHVGLAPLRCSPLWSMSLCDVLAAGRELLVDGAGGFAEVARVGLQTHYEGEADMLKRLSAWVSRPPTPREALASAVHDRLSPHRIASRFVDALEGLEAR